MATNTDTALRKRCTSCKEEFPATTEFFQANAGGKYGLRGQCTPCRRLRNCELIRKPETAAKRKLAAERYIASGRSAETGREWRRANPDKVRASAKKYRAANADAIRQAEQKRRDANRDVYRAKQRRADARLQKNPAHVLKKRIKARLRQMLKGKALGSTEAILGYSRADLVRHIERQFTKGMSWEALMRGEIHIDHILPVSSFSITGIDCPNFRACWALSNLQPLWASDNFKKQAKALTLL